MDSNNLPIQTEHMNKPPRNTQTALEMFNEAGQARFLELLGGVAENAPWVVSSAWCLRPFSSVDALHQALVSVIAQAPRAQQLALLNGHPELAGREAVQGVMTAESTNEQGRLGLLDMDVGRLAHLHRHNAAYRARFGFPFIVALRLHDSLESVWADAQTRLKNTPDDELPVALGQVFEVMRGRLDQVLAHTPRRPLPASPCSPLIKES